MTHWPILKDEVSFDSNSSRFGPIDAAALTICIIAKKLSLSPPVPLVVPAAPEDNPSPSQGWYPPAWQRFIDHVTTYLLHDFLFYHPFPVGHEGQKWAREAASAAFISYNCSEDITLDANSCKFGQCPYITTTDFHNSL